ncbi:phosphate ABC transporter substrate-binding protein PstS [Archaeoglobus sulfaticallidus]|nr:phosphate ABC transporter substrate-binding protein PstS [Archaeoglobus sulfaticallidus]
MRRIEKIVILVLISITIAGCTSTNEVTIIGSGATFPQPQIEKWIDSYKNVRIEYTGKGSGGGQNDFKNGLVDFACSDPPLKESLWRELESKGQPLQFPIIVGAVVVVHNIPGVDELKLTGDVVADIFMGRIEYWDDERIVSLNPSANLPHERIIVVHRSDSSGTTSVFTEYLSLSSDDWAEKVGSGKTVEWPVDETGRGIGGKGNQGVVTAIKNNRYSIGYTELAYVYKENLKTVALKNKAGKFVTASEETIKSAVSRVSYSIPSVREGYKENLRAMLNADGEKSYPIVAFSHMIIWDSYIDKAKERAIKDFVKWILTDGQKDENIVTGYVGLPNELAERLLEELNLT